VSRRLDRASYLLLPAGVIVATLAMIEAVVRGFDIATYVLPAPTEVFRKLGTDWDLIGSAIGSTLQVLVLGFLIGVAFGFVIAVAMAQSRLVMRGIYPILIASQAVPVIAIGAALTIWLGFGLAPKLVIVALIVFFPVVVNVIDGLRNVDPDHVALARTMGASDTRIFLHIRLPATVTPLFSALKLAATFSVTGAVFAEWTATQNYGVGNYLLEKNSRLDVTGVFAAILVLAVIGILFFLLVAFVERLVTPWKSRSTPRSHPWRRAPVAPPVHARPKGETT
jgi:ABC-type nitrate/sulfonate/bicarbonate transport system permease component